MDKSVSDGIGAISKAVGAATDVAQSLFGSPKEAAEREWREKIRRQQQEAADQRRREIMDTVSSFYDEKGWDKPQYLVEYESSRKPIYQKEASPESIAADEGAAGALAPTPATERGAARRATRSDSDVDIAKDIIRSTAGAGAVDAPDIQSPEMKSSGPFDGMEDEEKVKTAKNVLAMMGVQ